MSTEPEPIRHVPFIASYRGDFKWLWVALRSHKRHGVGWEPPVICTSGEDEFGAQEICRYEYPEARVIVLDTPPGGHGYLRAQCAMLSCDLLCPDGDVFWLFGSDTVLHGPVSPEDYWAHDYARPVMLYTPHATLGKITARWKQGAEAALGWEVENEFMRRLPLPYPRTLYPHVRARIEELHGMPWDQYVHSTGAGPNGYHSMFSESNVLGAYAWRKLRSIYAWVNTDDTVLPTMPVWQFWSHGGLERVDARTGKTPLQMITEWGLA